MLDRHDHEHLGEATLTLSELESLLDLWIRDEYHARPTRGLGIIRGIGDIPLKIWTEKANRFRTPLLPDPELFLALAGEVSHRTIQKDGITWDYIAYESSELERLLSHPKHRRRGEGGATKYEVVRDPFDLGSIIVKDPYRGRPIKVPATLAHASYATGLTLHQHRVIISKANPRKSGDKLDFQDLTSSRALLARVVASLRRNPGRKKVQRALARYLNVEQSRRHRSQILLEPPAKSPAGMIDWAAPSDSATPASPSALRPVDPYPGRNLPRDPDHDDLDALRRSKAWSVYNDG